MKVQVVLFLFVILNENPKTFEFSFPSVIMNEIYYIYPSIVNGLRC